jgi:cell filamentation protein
LSYTSEHDALCYSGTSVLKNIPGYLDQAALDEFEAAMYEERIAEPLPPGSLDYVHYRAIHQHLFQDVYDWAGEVRTIRIGKGGNWFCYPENLDRHMATTFDWLDERDNLVGHDRPSFVSSAAHFLSELNAGHPFREGNGRTQLVFLKLLVINAGLPFNDAAVEPDRTLAAMIASFSGNLTPLEALIADIIA